MSKLILVFFLTIFASGCQSEKRIQYKKCFNSGSQELYGKKSASVFCNCFSDGMKNGESPFEAGNRCAKPLINKLIEEIQ